MENHVKIVAIGNILHGLFMLFVTLFILLGVGIAGTAGLFNGEVLPALLIGGIGAAVSIFIGVLALPQIIGGIGLLGRKSWAHVVLTIVSVFRLISFPLGTIIGGYSLWVLFHRDTRPLLR